MSAMFSAATLDRFEAAEATIETSLLLGAVDSVGGAAVVELPVAVVVE
jgi:hypothetical protein